MSKQIIIKKDKFTLKEKVIAKQLVVANGGVSITAEVNESHIELSGVQGKSFVFMSSNSTKTLDRWEAVLSTMLMTVRALKEAKKL